MAEYPHGVYWHEASINLEPPKPVHGTCRMCGGHDRDLRLLSIGDYWDWTCAECIQQVAFSQARKFAPACEMTEPAE